MNLSIVPTIERSDDGALVVSSEQIAEGSGVQHKNVLELAATHMASLQRFGTVAFQTRPLPGGGNPVRIALLNEQQATLLMTFMRNTEQVVAFKVALVDAFYQMAKTLRPTVPQTYAEALRAAADAADALSQKEQVIALLEPKASAWDDVVSSSGSLSFRDAAKVISEESGINISGPRLTDLLMEWRWVFRPPSTPEEKEKGKVRSIRAYQTQIDAGTLTEKAKQYTDQVTGEKKLSNNPQTRVTGKGLDAIRSRLINQNLEVTA